MNTNIIQIKKHIFDQACVLALEEDTLQVILFEKNGNQRVVSWESPDAESLDAVVMDASGFAYPEDEEFYEIVE